MLPLVPRHGCRLQRYRMLLLLPEVQLDRRIMLICCLLVSYCTTDMCMPCSASDIFHFACAHLRATQLHGHCLAAGPVGSGRSEVPPVHSCNVAWLNRCPVLHTTGGHLYQTPSVQLVKVTLHRAQGLQNLHVDPVAAAAAAAAINRLAATGDSPIRSRAAERARQAATAATSLLGGTCGSTLCGSVCSSMTWLAVMCS